MRKPFVSLPWADESRPPYCPCDRRSCDSTLTGATQMKTTQKTNSTTLDGSERAGSCDRCICELLIEVLTPLLDAHNKVAGCAANQKPTRSTLLCTRDAAIYLGFKGSSGVRNLVSKGLLRPAGRRGAKGSYQFTTDSLDQFLTASLDHDLPAVRPEASDGTEARPQSSRTVRKGHVSTSKPKAASEAKRDKKAKQFMASLGRG